MKEFAKEISIEISVEISTEKLGSFFGKFCFVKIIFVKLLLKPPAGGRYALVGYDDFWRYEKFYFSDITIFKNMNFYFSRYNH